MRRTKGPWNKRTGQELVIVKGNGVVRVGDPAVAVPARGDGK
jgi:hypothetical protein